MNKIDLDTWDRADAYCHHSSVSHPFYSVTFAQDVTELYEYTHARGLSFYYALVFLCTKAINGVAAFRHVIDGGDVYQADRREPSFTDLHPGSEQFHIVTMPMGDELDAFCRAAREKSRNQTVYAEADCDDGVLIYYTCLPWMDVTGLTNDRDFDRDDTVPRLAWGKYMDVGGRKVLHISVEVNHRTVDGWHIGQFALGLSELIRGLGA